MALPDTVAPAAADPRAATAAALADLGAFTARLRWEALPDAVRDKAVLVVADLLGVTIAGARTTECRALLAAWDPAPGRASVIGAGRLTSADDAAWLNGTAACTLELDEGNKHAQGHPAAHLLFAALATAQTIDNTTTGAELLTAVVAGYEVAARFGRATRRRPDLHTHGHWGTAGAAAAVGRLRGLSAAEIAAAIDAATGLIYVTPWGVVLAGSFVRNLWIAGANVSGLIGARLAAAGLATPAGTAADTLGGVVGGLDPAELTLELGARFDITGGYFKRHASCSYTHPAADAALSLQHAHQLTAGDVAHVLVETHRLGMPLAPLSTQSRLAAMFSLPYVVAVALLDGVAGPESFDDDRRRDPAVLDLASLVEVRHDLELDRRLPAERATRLTITLTDGRRLTAEQPNPVGDADHHPFGAADVRAKLERLLGTPTAATVLEAAAALPTTLDARSVLCALP